MSDDVPPSSEELDVVFTQGKNGKLVFARDAEGNFFLDSRGVYKKAVQQLIDSQRDHTDTHDVSYLEQRPHISTR
jgi:predicted Rdx family selenoprotein